MQGQGGSTARSTPSGLRKARPNSVATQAPIWRVERGNVAATQAFSFACCPSLIWQGLPPASKRSKPIEPILQKHAMPFAHGVVIQKQGLGDFLAAPAGVEKHQRIGPPCQPVLHQTIPRQGDQVGAVLRRQKSSPNHATDKNRKIAQWQEIFRTFNDSGYRYPEDDNSSARPIGSAQLVHRARVAGT